MRIAILHNAVRADASLDDLDTLVQVEAIAGVLKTAGHNVISVSCDLDLAVVQATLRSFAPSLVVNLVESLDGSGKLIHLVPSLVERLGLPMTGCPSDGIFLTSNKLLAKTVLRAQGLPVPDWFALPSPHLSLPELPKGTLIIKSVWEHASIGLDPSSIIFPASVETLMREMANRRTALGGEWFAEQFIDGREFNLSVLERADGLHVLPPAEIRFVDFPEGMPHIVDFRAKWETGSFEYAHTVRSFEFAPEDTGLLEILKDLALRAFEAFGLSGYARVDFRVDETGTPFILEVNADPCLSPDAGFAAAAAQAGLSYHELVSKIIQAPLRSWPTPPDKASQVVTVDKEEVPRILRETVSADDRVHIEEMVRGTGFFSQAEVEIAVELFDAFSAEGTKSGYHFLICEENGEPIGFSTYGPIPGTLSSYDLYWVVVHGRHQRKGLGGLLLAETETRIRSIGGTRIYAETSGRDQYHPTRAFYEANGYTQEARMKNYYGPADDLMIYVKILN